MINDLYDFFAPPVGPTPAPAPTPGPAPARRPAQWLTWAPLLALALYVGYDHYGRKPAPAPQADPAFAAAFKQYRDGWGPFLARAADDIDSGATPTKAEFLKRLSAHAAPLETAIDNLFAPNVDAKVKDGPITNRAAVAGEIRKARGL